MLSLIVQSGQGPIKGFFFFFFLSGVVIFVNSCFLFYIVLN